MIELRYIMLSVAIFLVIVISITIKKYRNLLRTKETEISKEAVLGKLFLRKLKKLDDSAGTRKPADSFKELNKIMRNFFSELFDITYEFAYVELNEELVKKDIEEKLRKEIIDYNMQMAETEYSGHMITEQEFYYMLGKTIHIIEKVTGHAGEGTEERVARKLPEEGPKDALPGKGDKNKSAKLNILHRKGADATSKADKEKLTKIRGLLSSADESLSASKPEDAMNSYISLRVIYDNLSPEMKRTMYPETKRIIGLYNVLLKQYKDVLLGKEA